MRNWQEGNNFRIEPQTRFDSFTFADPLPKPEPVLPPYTPTIKPILPEIKPLDKPYWLEERAYNQGLGNGYRQGINDGFDMGSAFGYAKGFDAGYRAAKMGY